MSKHKYLVRVRIPHHHIQVFSTIIMYSNRNYIGFARVYGHGTSLSVLTERGTLNIPLEKLEVIHSV